jgi:hypothetical protein
MRTAYFILALLDPHYLTVRLLGIMHHLVLHEHCDELIEPLAHESSSDVGIPYRTVCMADRSQRHNVAPTHSLDPAAV